MKKNFDGKQKKLYHEILEEQDSGKEVFKRSEQPRKKAIVIKDETDKPKFNARSNDSGNKGYQKKNYDDEKGGYKGNSQSGNGFKKPYTPRAGSETSGFKKPYAPRQDNHSSDKKNSYRTQK